MPPEYKHLFKGTDRIFRVIAYHEPSKSDKLEDCEVTVREINTGSIERKKISEFEPVYESPEDYNRLSTKNVDNIEWDGIDHRDHPDYCDAYIIAADYNGRPMTEDELDHIMEDTDWKYDALMSHLY